MARGRPPKFPEAKGRILATASALFYRQGVGAVGVNEISGAAGVTKPMLYRHFGSKDQLVEACLAADAEQVLEAMQSIFANVADRTHTVRVLQRVFGGRAGRGLFLINVAVEYPEKDHPVRRLVQTTIECLRDRLVGLVTPALQDAGRAGPVSDHLLLLVLGASTACHSLGCAAAVETLAASIERVLSASA